MKKDPAQRLMNLMTELSTLMESNIDVKSQTYHHLALAKTELRYGVENLKREGDNALLPDRDALFYLILGLLGARANEGDTIPYHRQTLAKSTVLNSLPDNWDEKLIKTKIDKMIKARYILEASNGMLALPRLDD
jgi:hypothetical protein